VGAFVSATLQTVKYLKENPGHAAELVARRTSAPKAVADGVVAQLNSPQQDAGVEASIDSSVNRCCTNPVSSGASH
jgi:hypothetical protein